jgi:hypothetical protein
MGTTTGITLQGVQIDQNARIERCRSCGAAIWWGRTRAGKACPFDVIGLERTAQTHFSTCPQNREWSRKR